MARSMNTHSPIRVLASLLVMVLLALSSQAASQTPFVPNDKPVLKVNRAAGSIKIDGSFDDSGWIGAAKADNFAEHSPGDRVKPPVETEVLVTYDDDNFYLGFICHDNSGTIRASLRDRDEMFNDDYVGILMDTYGDAAWAYELFVNPFGIQGDLRMVSGGEEDALFDIVWESRGKITDQGYQVEVAIPFGSLRFPDKPIQEWRATFWRNRPRQSRERSTWAAIDRNNPCFICQFGTLIGMENAKPGRNIELLPSLIGHQESELRDPAEARSGLHNNDPKIEGSINLRYLLSSNYSAEATYNPDFSQVESDAAQIHENSSDALSYAEKRPFFQEGGDLFSTWINTVYTRSINAPEFALKFMGHSGRTSLGVISARDESTPILLPFEEGGTWLATGKSLSNIFRIKETLLEDSHVGLIATDRRLDDGGSGTVFGGDGSVRFLNNYRFNLQGLASHTTEPDDTSLTDWLTSYGFPERFDDGRHTSAFDKESYWGHAFYTSVSREASRWGASASYMESSPTFRPSNGLTQRADRREIDSWAGVFFRPNSKLLDEVSPSVDAGRVWNFRGQRKDEWIVPSLTLLFKAQTQVSMNYVWSRETYHGLYFPGIRRYELEVSSAFSDPVAIGFGLVHGRTIARNVDPPVLGRNTDLSVSSTIKLWQRLILRPEFMYSKLDYPDGSEIYSGYMLRSRVNYQFTREWFLRLIVQYNDFESDLSIEPLLSYKLNPFTIFYLGSTQSYSRLTNPTEWQQKSRQFFFKLQYLLRT